MKVRMIGKMGDDVGYSWGPEEQQRRGEKKEYVYGNCIANEQQTC